jgi:hypothetical protein
MMKVVSLAMIEMQKIEFSGSIVELFNRPVTYSPTRK